MRKFLASILVIFLSAFSSHAFFLVKELSTGTARLNVYFEYDKSNLLDKQATKIDRLFADQTLKTVKISLVGHTDNHGSTAYNDKLSKRRVEEVKEHLISLGYDANLIEIEYKGELQPEETNENDTGRAKNRRVTIAWEYKEKEKVGVEPGRLLGDINDLYAMLGPKEQIFKIDNSKENLLTLEQGTVVLIPANSFDEDNVTISAMEVYRNSDMILANLGTTSGGNLLETGGMLNIQATLPNGRNARLKNNKELLLMFPTNENRSDMQLFNGVHNQTINSLDWRPTQASSVIPFYPMNFNWPYLTGCGGTCDFMCRVFWKKDFAEVNELKDAKLRTVKIENRETRQCETNNLFWSRDYKYTDWWVSLKKIYDVETWEELRDTLAVRQQRELERRVESGEATMSELNYFVGKSSQFGWINCDAFSNFPESKKIVMTSEIEADSETDGQLVFIDRRSIMKAGRNGKLKFAGIVSGLAAWFVSIRFKEGKIYLAMKRVETAEEVGAVPFKEVSVDQLSEALEMLNQQ